LCHGEADSKKDLLVGQPDGRVALFLNVGTQAEPLFDDGRILQYGQPDSKSGISVFVQALALLGPDTRDVYLNDKAYWRNVPANVWGYYIGGYQVIKKWLSYREQELLGRALTPDEAHEVMNISRRLGAIILLQPALDDNYHRAAAHAYPWPDVMEAKV